MRRNLSSGYFVASPKPCLGGELCVDIDGKLLREMWGNQKIWRKVAEIFELLRDPVYRYLVGMLGDPAEAEDLVQDAFLRLYVHLCDGQHVGNVRAWTYRVAHNLALDHLRRNDHVELLDAVVWDRICEKEKHRVPDAELCLLEKERRELFQKAVERLSPQERSCLSLKAEGLTYREIGEVLGLRISTVATFVERGIKKLLSENND